jgi:hypothetical protein
MLPGGVRWSYGAVLIADAQNAGVDRFIEAQGKPRSDR